MQPRAWRPRGRAARADDGASGPRPSPAEQPRWAVTTCFRVLPREATRRHSALSLFLSVSKGKAHGRPRATAPGGPGDPVPSCRPRAAEQPWSPTAPREPAGPPQPAAGRRRGASRRASPGSPGASPAGPVAHTEQVCARLQLVDLAGSECAGECAGLCPEREAFPGVTGGWGHAGAPAPRPSAGDLEPCAVRPLLSCGPVQIGGPGPVRAPPAGHVGGRTAWRGASMPAATASRPRPRCSPTAWRGLSARLPPGCPRCVWSDRLGPAGDFLHKPQPGGPGGRAPGPEGAQTPRALPEQHAHPRAAGRPG